MPRKRQTRYGKATVHKAPAEVQSRTLTAEELEKMQSVNIKGLRRSQICARHNTLYVNGKCRMCQWEKKPKRKATPPVGHDRPEQVAAKPTGQVVEV